MCKKVAVALLVVASLVVLSLGSIAAKGAAPAIETGIFIDYGQSGPPMATEETDNFQIRAGITWSTTPVEYRDADGVSRLTSWPVKYYINPTNSSGMLGPDVIARVTAAFAAWEDDPESAMHYAYMGPPIDTAVDRCDGVNTVFFKELGSSGPVAYCRYWYYPNTKTILEFDIVFNDSLRWSTKRPVPVDAENKPTHFDVWSVATHEAGHTLILFDLYPWKDGLLTMYGYTWKGDDVKETLGLGDKLGIGKLYP